MLGTSAISYVTVLRWLHHILDRTGKQLKMTTEQEDHCWLLMRKMLLAMVGGLIRQDDRYTVEELAMLSGIYSLAAFTILKQQLKLRKVCARLMPLLLSCEQKQNRVDCPMELLKNTNIVIKEAKRYRHWR